MGGSSLIPRATVAEICRLRENAIERYAEAYDAMASAKERMMAAHAILGMAGPLKANRYNAHLDIREAERRKEAAGSILVPDRDAFMAEWKRTIETNVWARILEITDLARLMDKKAKDELTQSLLRDPPEATEENVIATLTTWRLTAGEIFRRGIANVFSSLDRRFKSHDGFKIGSRIILTGAFNDSGSWSYYSNHRDTLMDIERTFLVLDGKVKPEDTGGRVTSADESKPRYIDIVAAIDANRQRGLRPHQSDAESDYFRIHCFKNGNAHIWFKRDDLVEKVNKLLAEYYGEVIPDGMTPEDDGGLFTPKTSLAKNYGFFPTPENAADRFFDGIPLLQRADEHPLTILEPSAGTGNLARRCVRTIEQLDKWSGGRERYAKEYRFDNQVDCVEIQPALADQLKASGLYRKVIQGDFLLLRPDPNRLYDRIVMNPPFDRERDIDHVMHAFTFLKPDGFLTAIMSAGTEFRETKKSVAFRAFIEKKKGRFLDLPPGSFSEVGTNVNTIVLRVWNDGKSAR